MTLPAIVLGLILHGIDGRGGGLLFSLTGLFLGIGFLFIPYALGGMGAGDVKFLGAIGALQGPERVVLIFLYTAFVGGVMALVIAMQRKAAARNPVFSFRGVWENIVNLVLTRPPLKTVLIPEEVKGVKMPYGVAIGIGTLLVLFFGRPSWL